MQTLGLTCQCGQLQGRIVDFSAKTSSRVVCYCNDCRTFNLWTGHTELVNLCGGVDIVQVAQSQIVFDKGAEQIRCARLSSKGLYRFYAACCKMPLGNAMSRAVPLVGLPTELMTLSVRQSVDIGTAVGIHARSALTPPRDAHRIVPPRTLLRIIGLMLKWKLKSRGAVSPFFATDGKPVATPTLID